MKTLTTVEGLTRIDIIPYYTELIVIEAPDEEVKRVNQLILSKWTPSGLLYIKEKAWKAANVLGYTF